MTTAAMVAPVYGGVLFSAVPPLPRWRRWLRVLVSAVMACACLYIVLIAYLWSSQSRLLYMTRNSRDGVETPDPTIFQAGRLRTADGFTLTRITLEHPDMPARFWILFCMPAGGSIDLPHIQSQLQRLWRFDYNVLSFDYRGFGRSSGRPTEEGLYRDATTAYEYLTHDLSVPPDHVIIAGRSLGSAVALDLATRVPSAGLVLLSPIDSVPRTAERLFSWAPVRYLVPNAFDNMAKAPRVTVPVVVTYGSGDSMVPKSVVRALFGEFRGPKQMVETNGGHHFAGFWRFSDLFEALDRFWPVAIRS